MAEKKIDRPVSGLNPHSRFGSTQQRDAATVLVRDLA
jgi:hypothetical protein